MIGVLVGGIVKIWKMEIFADVLLQSGVDINRTKSGWMIAERRAHSRTIGRAVKASLHMMVRQLTLTENGGLERGGRPDY